MLQPNCIQNNKPKVYVVIMKLIKRKYTRIQSNNNRKIAGQLTAIE